jgi:hypothetical protein
MGPIARDLANRFDDITMGRDPAYRSFLTPTYAGREVGAA